MRKQLQLTKEKMKSALSYKDASYILEKISCNTERVFNKTKDRQRKFDKLLQEKQSSVSTTNAPCIDKNKWFINLSSRCLSD